MFGTEEGQGILQRSCSFTEKMKQGQGKDMFRKGAWTKWSRKELEGGITDLYGDIEMKGPW